MYERFLHTPMVDWYGMVVWYGTAILLKYVVEGLLVRSFFDLDAHA